MTALNANPKYLRRYLEAHPEMRGLHINMAHFAGLHLSLTKHPRGRTDTPYKGIEEGWRREIAELMELSEGVFTDTGYHRLFGTAGTSDKKTRRIRERYERELRGLLDAHPVLTSRLMFGSDWHMTMADQRPEGFSMKYVKLLSASRPRWTAMPSSAGTRCGSYTSTARARTWRGGWTCCGTWARVRGCGGWVRREDGLSLRHIALPAPSRRQGAG